ncbi:MAG: ABC transporter permease [Candidatus Bathyarchaeota archaeon]|nr:ABC transporter permease [Candidatus Bathyarchaeota archaeon]
MTIELLTENPVARFFKKTISIVEMDVKKLRHDPMELLTRAIQPALWLLVFGAVFSQLRAIPTGELSYIAFMAPGILAQSILFIAIFYGITIIWERDLGVIHKFLVSPTPRTALVLGKALSAGVRALSQVAIVYVLVLLVGVGIMWNPINLALVSLVAVLSAGLFSGLSLIIASLVKTRERFMGIGQVLTMPMFFTSNAIYPLSMMPEWLQVIAKLNPLTYTVDALRGLMVVGGTSMFGVGWDILVLFLVMTVLVLIGAKLYPRVVL